MGDWTGTVPTFTAGAKLRGVDMATLAAIATAETDAWTTWVPTLTSLTVGAGTLSAKYRRLGKWINYDFVFTYGASGSAVGSLPRFTPPATLHARYTTTSYTVKLGDGIILDSSGGVSRPAFGFWNTSGIEIWHWNATPSHNSITATTPWTWAVSDILHLSGVLELA